MTTRPMSPARFGRAAPLAAALCAAALLAAYARLLWPGAASADLGQMLFRPGAVPPQLVVGVAAYMLWQRRVRLRALAGPGAPPLAAGLLALGAGLFVWAQLTGAGWLLLPSLAANGLAAAAAVAGAAGVRAVLAPAAILLLGMPLPKPLEDEVVWQLQLATARGAGWLLDAAGRDFFQNGVLLRDPEHVFHVIDGCSGLNGIAILLLVALIVRELFPGARRRLWWGVALAPLLGFALNVVRVAYVAASDDPEALAGIQGDHTPQGLAVLMTGTALLYAFGWALARGRDDAPVAPPAEGSSAQPERPTRPRVVLGVSALLAAAAWLVPPFSEAEPSPLRVKAAFPEERAGWVSRRAPVDAMFDGQLSGGVHLRYRRDPPMPELAPDVVDVLVGFEDESTPVTFRLLSSKLVFPGPDWSLESRSEERIWLLDREGERAVASSGPGARRAVVLGWRVRHCGLWCESLRAWLALDRSPLRRERPRAAVRLVAYATPEGQLTIDAARQRLREFVADFHDELSAL